MRDVDSSSWLLIAFKNGLKSPRASNRIAICQAKLLKTPDPFTVKIVRLFRAFDQTGLKTTVKVRTRRTTKSQDSLTAISLSAQLFLLQISSKQPANLSPAKESAGKSERNSAFTSLITALVFFAG